MRTRGRLVVLVAAISLLGFLGCDDDNGGPSAPQTPPAQEVPPTPVVQTTEEVRFTLTLAAFVNDRLHECTELAQVVKLDRPIPATLGESLSISLRQHALSSLQRDEASRSGDAATLLEQSCTDAFGDRVVMGTCTHPPLTEPNADSSDLPDEVRGVFPAGMEPPQIASIDILASGRFYDFGDVFETDARMRECIDHHGNWVALRRDSPEFQDAKMEHDLREAERAMERARRRLRL